MSDANTNERCELCRFYAANSPDDPASFDGRGECRRFPPVLFGDMEADAWCWPLVEPSDWCGEFKPEPEPGPRRKDDAELPPRGATP